MNTKSLILNIIIALIPVIAGSLIGFLSTSYKNTDKKKDYDDWYENLYKPSSLSPPPLVFSIVWPILYLMLGASLFMTIYKQKLKTPQLLTLYGVFFAHLTINLTYPIMQFRLKSLAGAMIACWFTFLSALLLTFLYYRARSQIAIYLMIPYILWLSFACVMATHLRWKNGDGRM